MLVIDRAVHGLIEPRLDFWITAVADGFHQQIAKWLLIEEGLGIRGAGIFLERCLEVF